ncbi:unnamed protein product [Cuscuta europaea]|uniref:Uncharacterized protein n=1 Tax=Cuscuta europaea TaxID=41803 RepID=A0A9P0ZVV5_CUSEU|nr:unnamed protein product [Cuscuta europaea]
MGRGKVEMKKIENSTSRQVSFSKRKGGLIKKAHQLSVLCDAQIALIIFSPKGKPYHYCSPSLSMEEMIERYLYATGASSLPQNHEVSKDEISAMREKTLDLQLSLERYKGESLNSIQYKDLDEMEKKLEISYRKVRARKLELMQQQLENLRRTEKMVEKQNEDMCTWLMNNEIYRRQQEAMTELKLVEEQQPPPPGVVDEFPFLFQEMPPPPTGGFLSLLPCHSNHRDSDLPGCSYK